MLFATAIGGRLKMAKSKIRRKRTPKSVLSFLILSSRNPPF